MTKTKRKTTPRSVRFYDDLWEEMDIIREREGKTKSSLANSMAEGFVRDYWDTELKDNADQIKAIQEMIFGDVDSQQAVILAFVEFGRRMAAASRYQQVADSIEDGEIQGDDAMWLIAQAFWMEAQRYIPTINTLIITNADAKNEKAIADFRAFCDQYLAAA